ncbi:MAG: HlyC/CorC family transporter [Nitrospirae bacterium]|nr:MAG: HlyC/CorC family transporter [Nitrospirota bacterium]
MNELLLTAVALLVCLLLSGFFSSSETALLAVRRLKVRQLAAAGNPAARAIERLQAEPEAMLGAILIGNNLVNVAMTALATAACVHLFGEAGVAYATFGVTAVLLLFGEITPKGVAARFPLSVALRVARPVDLLRRALHPLLHLLTRVSRLLTAWLPEAEAGRTAVSVAELQALVALGEQEGALEAEAADRLQGVFALASTKVREIMVPRADMATLQSTADPEALVAAIRRRPYRRYPVEGEGGRILGVVTAVDLLLALRRGPRVDWDALLEPPRFVPETKTVGRLLEEMRRGGTRMAIVADEYGDITGLVTYMDIAEEITGRLGEEEGVDIVPHGHDAFLLDGRLDIGQINRRLDWDLPEGGGEYDTLAGWIISRLGHLPQEGEAACFEGYEVRIMAVDGRRLKRVWMRRLAPAEG